MLKYAGKFNRGDIIIAHDFDSRDGRGTCAIIGTVTNTLVERDGTHCYEIVGIRDLWQGHNAPGDTRVGHFTYVPHECMLEHEGHERVELYEDWLARQNEIVYLKPVQEG